jgi:hypothetical protein
VGGAERCQCRAGARAPLAHALAGCASHARCAHQLGRAWYHTPLTTARHRSIANHLGRAEPSRGTAAAATCANGRRGAPHPFFARGPHTLPRRTARAARLLARRIRSTRRGDPGTTLSEGRRAPQRRTRAAGRHHPLTQHTRMKLMELNGTRLQQQNLAQGRVCVWGGGWVVAAAGSGAAEVGLEGGGGVGGQ